MRRLFLLLVLLLCGVQFAAAQVGADLQVDASASRGPINPYVYGSNMNLYSIIPQSLMDDAQAMGINFMRFGGGDTDRMDMRTTIMDLFVLQMRQLGAEPLWSVRLLDGTPEAAAEWVRYANIEKGYNIRYWSIGNEPNLFVALMGAETYTVDDLSTQWRAIAEAMLEVDPTIQFIGPDITQYVPLSIEGDNITFDLRSGTPLDAEGNDWLIPFLEANGDLLAYVGLHRYPWPGNGGGDGATIDGLRTQPQEWDVVIPNLRTIIRNAAGRDIPIAISEINSNSANSVGGPASLDSHYNAIWLADTLGRMINNQVEMVTYWDMQGGAGRGWGLLSSYNVRPTGYTYMMYNQFGTELLAAQSNDPLVTVYAAQRDDGAVTVMVINLGDNEATKTLSVGGFTAGAEAEVWRFDQDTDAEQIESVAFSDGMSVTVPGQSLTLYIIPAAN